MTHGEIIDREEMWFSFYQTVIYASSSVITEPDFILSADIWKYDIPFHNQSVEALWNYKLNKGYLSL